MNNFSEIRFSAQYILLGCLFGGLIIGAGFGKLLFNAPASVAISDDRSDVMLDIASPSASIATPLVDNLVTILFTGDVMLGRSVNERIVRNNNPSWPFTNVTYNLRTTDITYINLESPLVTNCPTTEKGMKFCGDIGNVAGLVSAGVDLASVANNHATNYGPEGLNETVNALKNNGISVVGVSSPVTLTRKGNKYNFLSYNDVGRFSGIAQADINNIIAQIKTVKESGGLVVVGFHWGGEYISQPNSRQIQLAHSAIDAGADLIIGSHPHWVQTKEIYMGKPIFYSLGNFVFDQEWSKETKQGLVVRFSYRGEVLERTEELPVYIANYGQPSWQ